MIVSAGSLRNLEVRLSMAIDAALQAQVDLDALREKAFLPPAEKQFYLRAEHNIALAEGIAEALAKAKTEAKPPPPRMFYNEDGLRRAYPVKTDTRYI